MEDKVNNWINNLHLILFAALAIPALFGEQDRLVPALFTVGILIMVQCFHYVSAADLSELKGKDVYIHRLCIFGKVILVTCYLIITGYWFFSPLYYIVINPDSGRKEIAAVALTVLGTLGVWAPRIMRSNELSLFMLAVIVVLCITAVLAMAEKVAQRILLREHLMTEQIKTAALNELKIKNLNRDLAIKYQLADLNARLEERESIARNIHNVVGHTITSAIVSLKAYRVLQEAEPQRSEEKLTAAGERMQLALEEIRRAVRVLDQDIQEISILDFRQLLKTELERFSMDTELKVTHNLNDLSSEQAIDKRYCEFLHSALTECINNGIRHGKADSFYVFLYCDLNHIEFSVADNGAGFGQIEKEEQERRIRQGYGIRKMEQFVLEHGGSIRLSSDDGFGIHLELPLIRT